MRSLADGDAAMGKTKFAGFAAEGKDVKA